ncbi:MAG: hypothetical protein E6H75_13910 [Betaproteobacteria bacterium]|nr:MAG: hypothetical protein E6H75_13910 [Betaproteobacteria bacterium]
MSARSGFWSCSIDCFRSLASVPQPRAGPERTIAPRRRATISRAQPIKHALARHQATLEIESTPGKGSRFAAKFPARRVVPQRAGLSQPSASLRLEAAVLPSKEQTQSKP